MSPDLRRKLFDIRDLLQPSIRACIGPHLRYLTIFVDITDGFIALCGDKGSVAQGERYFITTVDEIEKNEHIKNFDAKIERIRNFLDLKHRKDVKAA